MSDKMLVFTLSGKTSTIWGASTVKKTGAVAIYIRTAPTTTAANTRWVDGEVPATMWPTREKSAGAAGTLQAFLSRKMTETGTNYTLSGIGTVSISADEAKEMAAGTARPVTLMDKINVRCKDQLPQQWVFNDLGEVARFLTSGPLTALRYEESLDEWTKSIMVNENAVVTALSEDEDENGVLLTDGETRFVPRTFRVINGQQLTDVAFLRQMRDRYKVGKAPLYVCLQGYPGTGKSALVEAAFASEYVAAGMDFNNDAFISCTADTTVGDLIGETRQDEETGIFTFVPGKLPKCMLAGVPLFVDEMFRAKPNVLSVLLPTIDRKVGILPLPESYGMGGAIKAKPGFYIVFAGNPNDLGARVSKALWNRITVKPWYGTNFDIAEQLLPKYPEIVRVARNLNTKLMAGEMDIAPQMRDLIAYREVADEMDQATALANMRLMFESMRDLDAFDEAVFVAMKVSNVPLLAMN